MTLTAQLQKTPSDDALRGKIIALVAKLKPTPAVTEDVERHMARGAAGVKTAATPTDFKDAAAEFDLAALAAPWHGDAYYNAGIAYAKAGDHAAAIGKLKLYLLTAPSATDKKEVKAKIFEEEFLLEKASSPKARAERVLAALKESRYAGTVTEFLECGVNLNDHWKCTETEARAANWVDLFLRSDQQHRASPNPVTFAMKDAEKGIIQFTSPAVEACGRAKGEGIDSVEWDWCDPTNARPGDSFAFATSSSGRATFTQVFSCGGASYAADACRRMILVFH